MKLTNQEKVWSAIAPQWDKFRKEPIKEVINFLKKQKGRVLDLGCGSGRNFIKINGTIYGVDFSSEMLKLAKKKAKISKIKTVLKKADAAHLPFKDDFFDAAICIAMIHSIPSKKSREKALKELYRVLKPDAQSVISVWDKNQKEFKEKNKELIIPWKYEGEKHLRYYYFYTKDEFEKLLKSTGFKIISIDDSENPEDAYSKRNIVAIVKK